jgi:hypothetical protein
VIRLLEPGVRVPSLAITRSAPRSLVTLDARSPRNDSATTPTPPTIPRVIISIATVIPVRRGLRATLRRPSLPGIDQPNSRPRPGSSTRLANGINSVSPNRPNTIPPPRTHHRLPPRVLIAFVATVTTAAIPPTVSTVPTVLTRVSERCSAAAERIACTGGTREARNAGITAASSVTPTPTANDSTSADGGTMSPTGSRAPLCDSMTDFSITATPTPRPSPTSEAPAPTSAASTSTEPTICRRHAPNAASSASSDVRWATRIENVFRIRKIPTNRHNPEKPSRTSRTISRNCLLAFAIVLAISSPVWTRYSDPSAAATRVRRSVRDTPGFAVIVIELYTPVRPSI